MGLLDEAIRDHLELKRRRGADPTEIARAEREALEPVFPGQEPRSAEPEPELDDGEPTIPVEHSPTGATPGGDAAPAAADDAIAADPAFSTLGQETAELDVEAYLDAEAQLPVDEVASAPARSTYANDDELLEWEEPSARSVESPPQQIPGQERLSLE